MRTLLNFLSFVVCAGGVMSGAQPRSDLMPPQKRQATVVLAEQLSKRKAAPPLPSDLNSPFNPPGFDKPEGSETPANPAAQTQNPGARTATPPPPPAPLGDRDVLEALAAQLTPTGMIQIGDSPRLVMGSKRFEVGTRFTVTYNGQDYELELVAIERTTFTLRYRGEEITRPIKSVR